MTYAVEKHRLSELINDLINRDSDSRGIFTQSLSHYSTAVTLDSVHFLGKFNVGLFYLRNLTVFLLLSVWQDVLTLINELTN
jgi:hypothetical protein